MNDDADDEIEVARRLGHDLYRWSRKADQAWPRHVREGYEAARGAGGSRTSADRYGRKWLQLRLGALTRGRAFDPAIDVALLRDIDVERCPITRKLLTHGEQLETDWSVDRLNNDGAYAVNNLAVMSVAANRAKGARSFGEVRSLAARVDPVDGLEPVEWLRLAALMLGPCHVEKPAAAPTVPQIVPIPPRTVHLAMQRVQHVLAHQSRTSSAKNALFKHLKGACHSERALFRLRDLLDRVHARAKALADPCDVWIDQNTLDLLLVWKEALGASGWAIVADSTTRLVGVRAVAASRMAVWRLPSHGYIDRDVALGRRTRPRSDHWSDDRRQSAHDSI